jgi:hypothetical protein
MREGTTSRVMAADRSYDEFEWEDGIIVGGEEWQDKIYKRGERKKLLRTARIVACCTYQWNE